MRETTPSRGRLQRWTLALACVFAPSVAHAVDSFQAPAQTSGTIQVKLYPTEGVATGVAKRVTFGVPFTRGSLSPADVAKVRVLKGGIEVPASVQALAPWRHVSDPAIDGQSVRVVRIQINYTFATAYPGLRDHHRRVGPHAARAEPHVRGPAHGVAPRDLRLVRVRGQRLRARRVRGAAQGGPDPGRPPAGPRAARRRERHRDALRSVHHGRDRALARLPRAGARRQEQLLLRDQRGRSGGDARRTAAPTRRTASPGSTTGLRPCSSCTCARGSCGRCARRCATRSSTRTGCGRIRRRRRARSASSSSRRPTPPPGPAATAPCTATTSRWPTRIGSPATTPCSPTSAGWSPPTRRTTSPRAGRRASSPGRSATPRSGCWPTPSATRCSGTPPTRAT